MVLRGLTQPSGPNSGPVAFQPVPAGKRRRWRPLVLGSSLAALAAGGLWLVLAPGPATTPAVALRGAWLNVDPAPAGFTRLVIAGFGRDQRIKAYARCRPLDCDWGWAPLRAEGETLRAVYDQGFARSTLTLSRADDAAGGLLVVEERHYADASGRRDRVDRYRFAAAP